MLDLEQRMRIEEEERLRIRIRQDQEKVLLRKQASEDSTIASYQQYVEQYGPRGALKRTIGKWMIAAGIISSIEFIGSVSDDGFLSSLKGAFAGFFVISGIGVWRAYKILSSSRP